MTRIVLASASPRRKALLSALGILFDVLPVDTEELTSGEPDDLVVSNARKKCEAALRQISQPSVVIGADTLVFFDGKVLSKPESLDAARDMLRQLSGNTHVVRTGLYICDSETQRIAQGSEETYVTFRQLTNTEIDLFVAAVRPLDRAGGYTVDGPGSLLVARYEGCFYNVLGLPIVLLDNLLRSVGVNLFEEMRTESAIFL